MTVTDRALDLDEEIINHLAIEDSVHKLKGEQVSMEIIEDDLARRVFDWQMNHLLEHRAPASAMVLAEQFSGVTLEEPTTAVGDLVERLRYRYARNETRDVIYELGKLANSDPMAVAKAMMEEARRLSVVTVKRGDTYSNGDFPRALRAYDDRVLRGPGASLGFEEVDAHFNGQLGITFLLAAPKTYKSWQTVKAVTANVLAGRRSYLYSLELPAVETEFRVACMMADVPYWKYLKGRLSGEDRQRLRDGMDLLEAQSMITIEKPAPGERNVVRLVERALNAGAECIFIDQLQYLETAKGANVGAANNTGDYFEVVNDLRDYSDQIPIFVVHQFNRSVMGASRFPEMQQAKGSAAIEEVATLALGLWASKEMRQNNEVEIGTLASRNYSYRNWRLRVELSSGCDLKMIGVVEDEDV